LENYVNIEPETIYNLDKGKFVKGENANVNLYHFGETSNRVLIYMKPSRDK